MTMVAKVNLAEAFARIPEAWSPHVAGDINNFQVKLVKLDGKFDWHHHDIEDELFLVVAGFLIDHGQVGGGRLIAGLGRFGRGRGVVFGCVGGVGHGVQSKASPRDRASRGR